MDKNLLTYKLKLEGESIYEESGKSGQTVSFNEIPYGMYTLTVDAYGSDDVLYYSAQNQVNTDSENTQVSLKLKYAGPQEYTISIGPNLMIYNYGI